MAPAPRGVDLRCAVHPARRATGRCPVCDRLRCGADEAHHGDAGCAACVTSEATIPAAARRELYVRAALAGLAGAYLGGWIAAQYVDTQYFSLIAPALVGLVCAWASTTAAVALPPRLTVAIAGVLAVLGTALSDRLVPGGQNLFSPPGHRLPPYAAAVVGAVLWPLLFGTPNRRHSGE